MTSHLVGMTVPETALEGKQFEISVSDLNDPSAVKLYIADVQNDKTIAMHRFTVHDGKLRALVVLDKAGVYRLELHYGESMPITQMVMVVPPEIPA
jgi:hypothetical protein